MLTDVACKNAVCPIGKSRLRLTDSGGLYLEISPSGSKRWFAKYRFGDKEKRLALGSYPEVALKAARAGRDAARKVHDTGADPVQARKAEVLAKRVSSAFTFKAVTEEYHGKKASDWSKVHAAQFLRCCEKDLFPWIGALPLRAISAPILLDTLRRVEARGATQLVRDLREFAGQVFMYGIHTGKCESNPARDLVGAFKSHTVKHMAAVLTPAKAGELMRAIGCYQGQPTTRVALLLSALLFQRPGNIRSLEWTWIDLDGAMLTIPAESMKRAKAGKLNGRPHLVPLAVQAVAALREIHPLTGKGRYVFQSLRTGDKPMSENTVNAALRGMGYSKDEMTAHGFRAMARTIMAENIDGIDLDVIESQLAHAKSGPLGSAYDRTEHMNKRKALMQTWADYLEQLRIGANAIHIKAA
ncbi:site-specific integrase [Roseateles sp.]|uniref:tyrosine-type recombinase/integrase n=1 Tax=Roseateles sp. TaxID=1971397 RepID=UPI0032637311